MGCFSVSHHQHKRKHRSSSSSSSSSFSVHSSVKSLFELRNGVPPPAPAPPSSSWSSHSGSYGSSARAKASLLQSASSRFAASHSRALVGSSPSLRNHSGDSFHESSSTTSYGGKERFISHSAPILAVEEPSLFPLPLPPATDDACTSTSSSSSSSSSSSASNSAPIASHRPPHKNSFATDESTPERTSSSSQSSASSSSCPLPLPPPPIDTGAALREFSYDEIAGACQNFSPQFFIRDGGAGPVFRAVIKDELHQTTEVAITCLTQARIQSFRRWRAETNSLARLNHPNLCKVLGFYGEDPSLCSRATEKVGRFERERLLVYEHPSNGSLESLLYGRLDKAPLDWNTRLQIATGAARGLTFLHDRIPRQIIYKSFKAINIQVDKDYNAKLSDYGFTGSSKELPSNSPAHPFALDDAYAAPETRSAGELSTKSNVWSFGMVLLELMTGRQNMDEIFPEEERNLLQWTRPYLLDAKRLYLVMDPELKGRYPTPSAKAMADLALLCLSDDPVVRPSMRQAALVLGSLAPPSNNPRDQAINSTTNNASGTISNGLGKLKSKSYNLASVLASPARSFGANSDQSAHPSRVRFRGFLSGEITKEATRSIAAVAAATTRSRDYEHHTPSMRSRYGFLSGEILQAPPSPSPMIFSKDYLPPPLGRTVSSSVTTVTE